MNNKEKEGKKKNNNNKTNLTKLEKNNKKKNYNYKIKRMQKANKNKSGYNKEKKESLIYDDENRNLNIEITSKKKNRINIIKVSIVVILVIAIIAYISASVYNLIINPTDTVVVKEGKISSEETVSGYIIREETVIRGENYKNGMVQIKSEGEKVASGDPIFRYYTSGEGELKKKIADLDVKIQEVMEKNNENLPSPDAKLLDMQIEEKLTKAYDINDIQKIKEYKKEISEYITKKAKIVGELSPSGSYLKKLIDERSGYESELNSGAEYVNATSSGIVSYKIDGLEETLNPNDFSKINKEFLDSLNLKNGQIISSSSEGGKIVNNFVSYIVCTSKSEDANNAKIGDNVKIVLPSANEIDAKIVYIIEEKEDENTIVFSITEGIDELLNYRKTSFDIIWWDAEGYKVPNSSIITENDLSYVIRTRAGYLDKVLVKVKKKTDSYSVVTNYSTSELKDLKLDKNVSTSIILYDELILKPTESQIKSIT